jgi:hypothetical protein
MDRSGQLLPRVRYFQAWNEPNLSVSLTPQWTKSGSRLQLASPALYRSILNAFYAGVKTANPHAFVLSAGTAPFGDLAKGGKRVAPVAFYRELLCSNAKVQGKKCSRVRFDGWAHHTYPIGPPTRQARNSGDVVVPDLPKLTRLMAGAVRAKTVASAAAKNLWVTEMSWDSFPDPDGLTLEDQAAYMQGAFYVLWKAGVKTAIWWNSRDDRKGSNWNATLQSGIFMRGTDPLDPNQDIKKPSWTAFHFPFAAYRLKGVASLWAAAPAAGDVVVQAQNSSGSWEQVAKLTARGGRVYTGRLRVGPGTQLRANQNGILSLPWRAS